MRRLLILLAALPAIALAQYAQPGGPLYPHNKNQLPPGAVIYDQGGGGIPTSGTEQAKQLEANRPGYQRRGPTIYHRQYDRHGSTAVISCPDGAAICRDEYGRKSVTGVCF